MIGLSRAIIAVLCVFALPWSLSCTAQDIPVVRTVVFSNGKIPFRLKSAEAKSNYAAVCKGNICYCDSDVEYVQIESGAATQAIAAINTQLKKDAQSPRCKYLDAVDTVKEQVTYLSRHFLSVVEHVESVAWTASGSCHGHSSVHTFDLISGKEYHLGDIISASSVPAVRAFLPEAVVRGYELQLDEEIRADLRENSLPHDPQLTNYKHYAEPPADRNRDLESARKAVQSLSDGDILNEPFFLKDHQAYLNVEGYYFSCAAGEFRPAEIPNEIITLLALHDELTAVKSGLKNGEVAGTAEHAGATAEEQRKDKPSRHGL
jgi:hypothetical protein